MSAKSESMIVAHKFGGSSLADAERIRHVAKLIRAREETRQVVVVSAMQKVTDGLIALADAASSRRDWRDDWSTLRDRHLATADALLNDATSARAWLNAQFHELAERLHAISVLGGSTRDMGDAISGLGEVWSAHLVHAHVSEATSDYALLDARDRRAHV